MDAVAKAELGDPSLDGLVDPGDAEFDEPDLADPGKQPRPSPAYPPSEPSLTLQL
jgi:hypothetical protein